MRARHLTILVGLLLLLLATSCTAVELPPNLSTANPVVQGIVMQLIRLDTAASSQPFVNQGTALRLPSFIVCPSGIGRPGCYIDLTALGRWLCDNRILPRFICRVVRL